MRHSAQWPRRERIAARRVLVIVGMVGALLGSTGLAAASAATTANGSYIVMLKAPAARSAAVARDHGAQYRVAVTRVYGHALSGYAARLDGAQVRALRADPSVAAVVPDGIASIDDTQTGAPWGLDRIDQRKLPLSGTFTYTRTGAGVTAYVIDTGIRTTHTEFGGRAQSGWDFVDDDADASDCNGHGTHVAGTIGGTTYGVAKGVALVSVRVLDCQGFGLWSEIIAGIDFVTAEHQPGEAAVANMSLGGGANLAVDAAVRNSIADGVAYAVAAGNSNFSACQFSPARVPEAMTVAASTSSDAKASFSNWGTCVDWFAPGQAITSSWGTSDTATNTISGTSMASPHTAGVAAQLLQGNPSASPASIARSIQSAATSKRIGGLDRRLYPGTANLLLFTNQ
ncbi:MAG TPA: S8 family peptidase [Candidatus Limnocylindrales bacterium]|nr:S8 family peptidase [Candidatus Limnocylindrales bacterium]